MSERMEGMLESWCGSRKEGWVFPSPRSKSGHLITIAKNFQAARDRAGLDKRVVSYSARHTYGTYTKEESKNAFAVSKSMGHADLKSMEPYQHQELEPRREAIDQRNRRKSFVRFLDSLWQIKVPEQTNRRRHLIDRKRFMLVDAVGIEPTTCRLRVECSAS
jgi:integrase